MRAIFEKNILMMINRFRCRLFSNSKKSNNFSINGNTISYVLKIRKSKLRTDLEENYVC